jgi:hypothetical protein
MIASEWICPVCESKLRRIHGVIYIEDDPPWEPVLYCVMCGRRVHLDDADPPQCGAETQVTEDLTPEQIREFRELGAGQVGQAMTFTLVCALPPGHDGDHLWDGTPEAAAYNRVHRGQVDRLRAEMRREAREAYEREQGGGKPGGALRGAGEGGAPFLDGAAPARDHLCLVRP